MTTTPTGEFSGAGGTGEPWATPTVSWETELAELLKNTNLHHRELGCINDAIRVGNIERFIRTKKAEWEAAARQEGREEAVEYIKRMASPEWDSDINDDDKFLVGYSVSLAQLFAARHADLNK